MNSKKTDIEHVLGVKLTDNQLAAIKKDWNAFYNNPYAYRGGIVVAMVTHYLKCS
ncbi:hypothetical protein [Acetivibrio ethanolgignens]|uniref:hypothetical protein n=1 Tax=Acetivibrio ethanolgignens TaxID=290052 RepID=UPI0012DBD9BE|nr:hypothetical protein [Acetivibrio ethanolgignens]